jgi:hypothetical protein
MEDVSARMLIHGGAGLLSVRPRTPGTSACEMSTELVLRLARVGRSSSAFPAYLLESSYSAFGQLRSSRGPTWMSRIGGFPPVCFRMAMAPKRTSPIDRPVQVAALSSAWDKPSLPCNTAHARCPTFLKCEKKEEEAVQQEVLTALMPSLISQNVGARSRWR